MANSYFATYHSTDGKPLLGGVLKSQTSRFGNRKDAELRLQQTIELNNNRCVGEVHESKEYPEIFTHCGDIAQAIGGKCFRCGKVLTRKDAKENSGNFEIGEAVCICLGNEPQMLSATVVYQMPEVNQVVVDCQGRKLTMPCDQVYPTE